MSVKRELYKHRAILIIGFIMIFFAFGIPTYSMPFIYAGAVEEFGWSKEQVNLLSTAKFLVGAAAALVMGILVDKHGARWITTLGALVSGGAMLLFIGATTLPVYYLAGAFLGFAASSVSASMKIIVARSFGSGQGTAMGIVLTATSAAGIFTPQILPPMMQAYGWRLTMGYMSAGVLLIALPAWLIAIRLNTDLATTVSQTSPASHGLWNHFRVISRDRNFWLIALGIFLVSGIDQAMMHNYVLFLREDKGLDWRSISWGGSLLAIVGVIAKIGSGWVYDRLSIRGIMLFYVLLGVSIFMGLPVVGIASMLAFLVVRGVAHGGLIVDVPILTKHYFGMEHIGMTIGIMALFMQLGFAVGPPVLGRFADATGNYSFGLTVYGSLAILAALTLVTVKPRYWTPPSRRPRE